MKTLPAAFLTALAKNSGTPLWILSLTAGGATYYLSDQGRTIPTWLGGVTLRPWVRSWGKIIEALGLGLSEIRISEFSSTFRIDPLAVPNMETVASAADIEGSPAILYFWLVGLDPATNPPQAVWSGHVDDVDIPDDATVEMTFEDGSSKLRGNAGTVITSADYPKADPDDVGKILPIIYGSVDRIPAPAVVAGRMTTLTEAVTTITDTSFIVLDPTGLAVNDYQTIGTEDIKITAISGSTLTVSRGQNSTTKSTYALGAPLFQQMSATPFVFVAADAPVTALDRVRVSRDGIDVDITDLVSRYTGQSGSQYSGYSDRAVVVIPTSSARLIRARLAAALNTSDLALTGGVHSHTNATTSQATQSATAPVTVNGTAQVSLQPAFPAVSGTILSGSYVYNFSSGMTGPGPYSVKINGVTAYSSGGTYNATDGAVPYLALTGIVWTCYITLSSGSRTVTYTAAIGAATVALTGAVNSVADNEIGGQILVDVTATQSACLDAVNDLLTRALGSGDCTLTGAFPAGYTINGAILKPKPIIEIIHQIAFECRAWFRVRAGVPALIVRPDALTSSRTLSACAVDSDHVRQYRRKKTALDDVLNTITLRFGRDYTQVGSDAYTQTSVASDATSIATYGPRQKDALFRCDFITSPDMAASVVAYYLARYKSRGWLHQARFYLDQLALEFGDPVTLGFAGDVVGEVMEARLSPGQDSTPDGVELIIETNSGIPEET